MSVLPYHKRYHSDALAGFMPLTLEERGAYQTLLDMMYDRGGPLIDNERLLAGYMNCSTRKWRQIRDQLISKQKIYINSEGLIVNKRARKEIENASKTQRKLIEAGAKGGRTRAENEKLSNENSGTKQASLEAGSSDPQAIRAASRSQKPEVVAKTPPSSTPSATPKLPADLQAVMDEAGLVSPPDRRILQGWYDLGATLEQDILPVIRRTLARERDRGAPRPGSLKYFDGPLREKLAQDSHDLEALKRNRLRWERIAQEEAAERQAASGG